MIAMPNLKIKLLKPFLTLCLMVGALFCAPAVSAVDLTSDNITLASPDDIANSIIEHYNLNADDCSYMYSLSYNNREDKNYYLVVVFVSENSDNISFTTGNNSGSPTSDINYAYNISQSNSKFYYCSWYFDVKYYSAVGDRAPYKSSGTFYHNMSGKSPILTPGAPVTWIYTNPVVWYANFDTSNVTHNDEFVSFESLSPPVETDSQTYANAMLQEYLHKENFTPDMSTAWLISPSGQPTQIPLSYSTPTNYNGDIWVQFQNVTPYLDKFTPRFSENFNAVNYSGYKLAISYDVSVSYIKLYALTDKIYAKELPFDVYINDTIRQDSSSTLPQTKGYYDFDGVSYFGSLYEQDNASTNDRELLYCIWDFNPSALAAVPRLAPLYCALDVRTVDSNGNTVISRDSNDYRQFVTNYNQKAISGLTGTYTGSTFSKQSWRGQSVSQDVDYSNDFAITYDSNLGQVFSTIFSMGNGYILTLCLGGLSIAFAAYVLFGKH